MIRKTTTRNSEYTIKYCKSVNIFTIPISKNDLPAMITKYKNYMNQIYCYNRWGSMINNYKDHRDNDLPSSSAHNACKFNKFNKMFKYNGHGVYNSYLTPNRFYKFINGICFKLLKEEMTND